MAKGPNLSMQKKMLIVLFIVFGVGFLILAIRLVVLQIVDGKFYSEKALKQQMSVATISANRGTIYDRNMKALAESATVWDVAVSPSYIKTAADRTSIAQNLAKILNMNESDVLAKVSKKSSYEIVARKIEKPTADLVRKYITAHTISSVSLIEDSKRYYPFGNFASQLLGFTGTDNQGLNGVEAEYDSELKGVSGRVLTAKNATGTDMPYDYEDYVAAQKGNNVVLTLDEVVQHYLESNLKQALTENKVSNRVTGIVMNVQTGEILAMDTEPGYDPNDPFTISDSTLKSTLSGLTGSALKTATANAQQTQWRNKAITEPYEPGSTFKIITAAAGLDEGVVTEDSQFYDGGSTDVSGTTFHCWKAGGHGQQTFLQGFENSCNVVFIEVGRRLGALNFYKYFSNFGLTDKTGIDLPGEADSITYNASQLGPVQLASSSFGQSNKITPIQLITAVSAAANGGNLVQPHVVKEITDSNGNVIKTYGTTVKRQVISSETSKEICTMLQMEVQEGTGKNAYVAGYRVGGKTGTSQKLDSSDPNALIASFVGVAPCDNPKVAVLILMDEPHASNNFGGVIAAPVVGSIMSQILPYLGVEPQYTAAELQNLDVKTPDLSGKSIADATSALRSLGLGISASGSGQTVTGQVPAAGESIPKNGKVIVYTGGTQVANTATVPNVTGLSPSDANKALAAAGLNIKYVGTALTDSGVKAYEQDQAAGSKVAPGTVVTVHFRNEEIKVQ